MITRLLKLTAWPMTPPKPYSFFHIFLCLAGISFSICLAVFLSRRRRDPVRRLFLCGLILAVSEVYKQLFLTLVAHPGVYDWWYFPFQLCSIPMYLCLILPLLPEGGRRTAATFLQDFGLLGGFMALAEPSGLMHPYITLTLHGFIWHFILIFTGVTCFLSPLPCRSRRGFLRALPLFLVCCLIALFINWAAGPDTKIDMFYISPYHPSQQVVFHQIALITGIFWGNVIYVAAAAFGAFLIHLGLLILSSRLSAR